MKKLIVFLFLLYAGNLFGNVVGVGVQNFHPTYNGLDFVTVHSSQTLPPGIGNVGFFINYSENTLPYFRGGKEDDQTWSSQLHLGLGLMENWDIGYSIPMLNSQEVASQANVGSFIDTGVTEHRIQTKYRFFNSDSWGAAFIGSVSLDNTDNFPLTGEDAGPIWNLELALDKKLSELMAIAFNVGYRFRDEGEQITQFATVGPLKDQWIASIGANYQVPSISSVLISEIYTSFPANGSNVNTDKEVSSAEWILGLKYIGIKDFDMHFGGGSEILSGTSTPDWRVYTGFNWRFGPLWKKSEEVQEEEEPKRFTPPPEVKDKPQTNYFEQEEEEVETIDISDFTEIEDVPVKKNVNYVVRNINFDFNSDRLDRKSQESLKKFAVILKKPPRLKLLTIEGHTDGKGSDSYNLKLSQRRANAVKKFLAQEGVPSGSMKAVGYGESKPIATNETEAGRTKNRRVAFKVRR